MALASATHLAQAQQPQPDASKPTRMLKHARMWGYQLQNINARAIGATDFDVVVVDAGSGDGAWGLSKKGIARLKTRPDGARRTVRAYVNIGEAEDYRYYCKKSWEQAPPACRHGRRPASPASSSSRRTPRNSCPNRAISPPSMQSARKT